MFINVYLVDRAYGGPEEGGWYYNYGLIQRVIPVSCPRVGERVMGRVKRVLDGWNGERRSDIGSVLSEGRFEASLDREPGKDWPEQRPFYE